VAHRLFDGVEQLVTSVVRRRPVEAALLGGPTSVSLREGFELAEREGTGRLAVDVGVLVPSVGEEWVGVVGSVTVTGGVAVVVDATTLTVLAVAEYPVVPQCRLGGRRVPSDVDMSDLVLRCLLVR